MIFMILNIYLVGALAALAVIMWAAREIKFSLLDKAVVMSTIAWPMFFYFLLKKFYMDIRAKKDAD